MTYKHDFRGGDTIRRIANPVEGVRAIRDVSAVQPHRAPCSGYSVCYIDNTGKTTWSTASDFELIARAGEPVKYQAGDVVEYAYNKPPTVRGKVKPGVSVTTIKVEWDNKACSDYTYVPGDLRLVHRPDAAVSTIAAVAKELRPSDLQVGDRARFIFEATVTGPLSDTTSMLFSAEDVATATIELIDRPPLKPGDKVRVEGVEGVFVTQKYGETVIDTGSELLVSEAGCAVERA